MVTNHGYSDWSSQDLAGSDIRVFLRVRREGSDYWVEHRLSPDEPWRLMRLAHLAEDDGAGPVSCGLYACSPVDSGGEAEFEFLHISPGRAGLA